MSCCPLDTPGGMGSQTSLGSEIQTGKLRAIPELHLPKDPPGQLGWGSQRLEQLKDLLGCNIWFSMESTEALGSSKDTRPPCGCQGQVEGKP